MKPDRQLAERRAVLNEFGDVEAAMNAWTLPPNPHEARWSELRKVILSWGATEPPEIPYTLESKSYRLDMKPCQQQRDMGPAAQEAAFRAFEKLKVVENGKAVRFNPFTVFETTIAAITKHLGEAFLDKIAPKERTGRRPFEVVAKSAKVKAA